MLWLMLAASYLIGSIPSAYIIGRMATGQDIRRLGDGNAGARNAFHEVGHSAGFAIFLIDALKGAAVILLAKAADMSQNVILICGVLVVVGHNWPVFLKFRGGRGESTTLGILYVLIPLPMVIMTIPVMICLLVFKNVIVASAFGFISLPFVCWWLHVPGVLIIYALGLAILVGFTHFLRRHGPVRESGSE
jgi:acyl phosphate:glycerol-3-phosphate acyltransferase